MITGRTTGEGYLKFSILQIVVKRWVMECIEKAQVVILILKDLYTSNPVNG